MRPTTPISAPPAETYLPDNVLSKRYSVSRATIWRWVREGRLPKPVKLGPGCTRWPMSAIEQFEAEAGKGAA
jgi:prophage regulatory protein